MIETQATVTSENEPWSAGATLTIIERKIEAGKLILAVQDAKSGVTESFGIDGLFAENFEYLLAMTPIPSDSTVGPQVATIVDKNTLRIAFPEQFISVRTSADEHVVDTRAIAQLIGDFKDPETTQKMYEMVKRGKKKPSP